jgi:hypothetical protein
MKYKVIHRGKLWGTFDYFHEAWSWCQLYITTRLCRIECGDEFWVVIPAWKKEEW